MSIFKKRGKWWVGASAPDGRWIRRSVGSSYTLARQVEAKLKAEIAEGKFFPERTANKQTFESLSAQYLKLHGPNLRSVVWKHLIPHINAEIGTKAIGGITAQDIQAFCNKVEARTSASTANRHLTLIKAIFNKAKTWGLFHGENPCVAVKMKKEPNHRLRYLTKPEIKNLLENCDPRLYPVVACALMTGMRKGEILNLQWQDIDLGSNTIQILQSKSGKPRKIPIMPPLRAILEDLGPHPAGSVFNMPYITLRRHFKMALEASRITSFRFHDLRHTFASHFAMTTGDLPTLQQILGHAGIQMTLRYAHLSDNHMAAKMALLSKTMPIENRTIPAGTAPLTAPPQISIPANIL